MPPSSSSQPPRHRPPSHYRHQTTAATHNSALAVVKAANGVFVMWFKKTHKEAYTREDFAISMTTLQNVQHDAYQKLCEAGVERWSRAHCPLVRYNYMTSNSVESVNFKSVIHRKEPVFKALAETVASDGARIGLVPLDDAIQEPDMINMYTHHNRLHVYVSRVELSPLVVAEQQQDATNITEKQGKPSCAKKLFD
ncbi:hypothetical protein Tco_0403469 [Tanacetum coccineum]